MQGAADIQNQSLGWMHAGMVNGIAVGADRSGSSFWRADSIGLKPVGVDLSGADLRDALMINPDLTHANRTNADFSGDNRQGAIGLDSQIESGMRDAWIADCGEQSMSRYLSSMGRHYFGSLLSVALAVFAVTPGLAADSEAINPGALQQIMSAPPSPTIGAPTPRVTLVEYFDYNCPYCKRLAPILTALLAADPTVALMYKDWPILSKASIYAAHGALAAKWQDKYSAAHDALMSGPRLSSNSQVDDILRAAGIDMSRLKGDLVRHAGTIDALIERNNTEAQALGLRGTPGVLVGNRLMTEVPTLQALQALVNASHP